MNRAVVPRHLRQQVPTTVREMGLTITTLEQLGCDNPPWQLYLIAKSLHDLSELTVQTHQSDAANAKEVLEVGISNVKQRLANTGFDWNLVRFDEQGLWLKRTNHPGDDWLCSRFSVTK